MIPSDHIPPADGNFLLSAREAAARLDCAPDYVTKLCRDSKLDGVRIKNVWYVKEGSISVFEAERAAAKIARSEELAQQRKLESENYQRENSSNSKRFIKSAHKYANSHAVGFAVGSSLLFGS